ncbi:ribbon-helix-helix protein, CopG family [Patulibacter sp. S7RM1-6]
MATNLRLRDDAAAAVREAAARSGRSQQELIRAAVDRYLGLGPEAAEPRNAVDDLVARGTVRPARLPFRTVDVRYALREGMRTADLLDREERR